MQFWSQNVFGRRYLCIIADGQVLSTLSARPLVSLEEILRWNLHLIWAIFSGCSSSSYHNCVYNIHCRNYNDIGRFFFARPCFFEFSYIKIIQIRKCASYIRCPCVFGWAKLIWKFASWKMNANYARLRGRTLEEANALLKYQQDMVTVAWTIKNSSLQRWNWKIVAARARVGAETKKLAGETEIIV